MNSTTAYAALGQPSSAFGVYLSIDAGQTWSPANGTGSTALPSNEGRITLVAAPSSPLTLYASIEDPVTLGLAGMFKTTDGGAHWSPMNTPLGTGGGGSTKDFCETQCWFDMALAVSPNNANILYAGGTNNNNIPQGAIFMTTDGGTTWNPLDPWPGEIVHWDFHALAFDAGGDKLYLGNDGGIWSTSNIGATSVTWADLNATLALAQFYQGFTLSASSPNPALIGSQDNRTQLYAGTPHWSAVVCGDGLATAINPLDNNMMWALCLGGGGVQKSTDGGTTWNPVGSAIQGGGNTLTMDLQNPNTVYVGNTNVWQTTDDGGTWAQITSSNLGFITGIAVSPVSSSTLFVSTGNNFVWFSTNTGASWTHIMQGLPLRYVTTVQGDPQDSSTFYATFSGFSGFLPGDTYGHIFKCTTAGACTDISSNLPNIPINDIVIDPIGSNTLYVATDIGVFRSLDGGLSWSTFSAGLPNVVIHGLRLHAPSRTLIAASWGRSAWEIAVPAGGTTPSTTSLSVSPHIVTQGSSVPVVLTATVTPGSGSGVPTGKVIFFNGGAQLGTVALSGGTATFNYNSSNLPLGSYSIVAAYEGDATFASSRSAAQSLVVGRPVVTLSARVLAFTALITTSSAPQSVTVTNSGTSALNIVSIGISGTNSGDFAETNTCPATLGPAANCAVSVTFTGTLSTSESATLNVVGGASDSPQTVTLSGASADFAIEAATGTNCAASANCSASATVSAGQTANYSLEVAPINLFNLQTSLSCSGAPALASCSVVPNQVIPTGHAPAPFGVAVTTTAPSLMVRPRWITLFSPTGLLLDTLLLLMLSAWLLVIPSRRAKRALVSATVVLLLMTTWAGCGGGGGGGGGGGNQNPGTTPGTYTLTITGLSKGVSRTMKLTMTVN